MTDTLRAARQITAQQPRAARLLGALFAGAILVAALFCTSLLVGSRPITPGELNDLLGGVGSDEVHTLLWEVRLPRTVAATLVGVALAWAGTLMQSMTRNPLADPGLLGVSSGAAFAVVIGMSWLGLHSATGIAWAAVFGAAIVTGLVLVIGLRGSAGDGSKLILAGVAFSMTVSGVQSAIILLNPRALDAMRSWSAGSLASPNSAVLQQSIPVLLVGAVCTLALIRPLNTLSLGDELARSLGSHPLRTRALTGVATACLVGAATAIAGPIGFVGLMVPHIVRPFTGPAIGRVLAASTLVGAVLLLSADILARIVIWPGELPVGVVCAAIGAPVIFLAIRRKK